MSDDSTSAGATIMNTDMDASNTDAGSDGSTTELEGNELTTPSSADATATRGEGEEGEEGGDGSRPSELPSALPPRPLAPVEKMEVEVDFEVGRVTLAVSALANVAQGAVIDVGSLSLDSVVAKSGGVAFARGEFVELGGRVGFRITKLFGSG